MSNERTKEEDPQKLQVTIEEMSAMARQGFSAIGAVSKLLGKWLESPESRGSHGDVVVPAVQIILERAEGTLSSIDGAAWAVVAFPQRETPNQRYTLTTQRSLQNESKNHRRE